MGRFVSVCGISGRFNFFASGRGARFGWFSRISDLLACFMAEFLGAGNAPSNPES